MIYRYDIYENDDIDAIENGLDDAYREAVKETEQKIGTHSDARILAIGHRTGWNFGSGAREVDYNRMVNDFLEEFSGDDFEIRTGSDIEDEAAGVFAEIISSDHDGSTYYRLVLAPYEKSIVYRGVEVSPDEDNWTVYANNTVFAAYTPEQVEISWYKVPVGEWNSAFDRHYCENGLDAVFESLKQYKENRLDIPVYNDDHGFMDAGPAYAIMTNLVAWSQGEPVVNSFSESLERN